MTRDRAVQVVNRLAEFDTEYGSRPASRAEAAQDLSRWKIEAEGAVAAGRDRPDLDVDGDGWFASILDALRTLGAEATQVYLDYVFRRNPTGVEDVIQVAMDIAEEKRHGWWVKATEALHQISGAGFLDSADRKRFAVAQCVRQPESPAKGLEWYLYRIWGKTKLVAPTGYVIVSRNTRDRYQPEGEVAIFAASADASEIPEDKDGHIWPCRLRGEKGIAQGADFRGISIDEALKLSGFTHVVPCGAVAMNPAAKPKSFRPPKVVVQVQLQKETRPGFETGRLIAQPTDIVKALDEYMGGRATEVYIALFVNVRNQLVGYTEMSSGSVASVEVDASGLFRDALASGAAGVFTAHNHPSGDPTPSDADRALWARLRDVGRLIGIPVVDNMVIGRGGRFFSEMQESP